MYLNTNTLEGMYVHCIYIYIYIYIVCLMHIICMYTAYVLCVCVNLTQSYVFIGTVCMFNFIAIELSIKLISR